MPEVEATEEEELTEESDDPEERDEELEREAEERRAEMSAEVAAASDRLVGEATRTTIKIAVVTERFPAAERALEPRRVTEPRESASDEDAGKEEKKRNTKAVDKVLKEAVEDKEGEGDEDNEKKEKKKEGNLRKMVLFLTAATFFGPQLKAVFEALVRSGKGDGGSLDDLIKDAGQRAALLAAAKAFADEPDEKYWADIAALAERFHATVADLVYFLQYQMLLYPLGKGDQFAWDSWSDENEKVEELIKTYKESKEDGKKGVLEELAKIQYDDLPVPRVIAASLGQQAFARIIVDGDARRPKKDEG